MPTVRRLFLALAATAALAPLARADAPKAEAGKVVEDTWFAAYLDGTKAGSARHVVREVKLGEQTYLEATEDLLLVVRRFGEIIRFQPRKMTRETPDGTVVGAAARIPLGKDQNLVIQAAVSADGKLRVTGQGAATFEKEVRWSKDVVGLVAEHAILKGRETKPGTKFKYLTFEPTVSVVVEVEVEVKGVEEVSVNGSGKKKLLRYDATPAPIEGVQLPVLVTWCDPKTFRTEVSETDLTAFGLGNLRLVRSDKPVTDVTAPKADMAVNQSVVLDERLADPHRGREAVYRVRLPGLTGDLVTAFSRDARQSVRVVDADKKVIELAVTARRQPPAAEPKGAAGPGAEYLTSNYFINSDDPTVKAHAAKALARLDGRAKDDLWARAKAVERWVHDNMKVTTYSEAMATADRVASNLEGDCTEYSMLTAAMCRAAGVPSRTALGLVYFERNRQPMMAYHMWTEVWVRGEWLALDATLGMGSVGVGHLKVADHSWHETRDLRPTLPVMRVLAARPMIGVVRAEGP